ncbi:HotDog domain-containing protein [Tuber brumale]|nr:HotDog domain-containing protein [Tuber brumale]
MVALSKLASALGSSISSSLPTWNIIFKLVFLLLALVNIKSIPLTWHFRFYRSLYFHLLRRKKALPGRADLFSPITTTSRSPLYECDLNLHKSNSTYFSDLDIARTHLVCHLIKKSLSIRRKSKKQLYVALAGVSALFRREIKPFEKYEVVTRLLCWDTKWVFVVSHFVALKKGLDGKRKIFATCISKYVFKQGRVTVPPEEVLRESGLLPERPVGAEELTPAVSGTASPRDDELVEISGKAIATAEAVGGSDGDALMRDLDRSLTQKGEGDEYWTWERIEAERKRGCGIAKYMIGLDPLDNELRDGTEEGLVHIGNWY